MVLNLSNDQSSQSDQNLYNGQSLQCVWNWYLKHIDNIKPCRQTTVWQPICDYVSTTIKPQQMKNHWLPSQVTGKIA